MQGLSTGATVIVFVLLLALFVAARWWTKKTPTDNAHEGFPAWAWVIITMALTMFAMKSAKCNALYDEIGGAFSRVWSGMSGAPPAGSVVPPVSGTPLSHVRIGGGTIQLTTVPPPGFFVALSIDGRTSVHLTTTGTTPLPAGTPGILFFDPDTAAGNTAVAYGAIGVYGQ